MSVSEFFRAFWMYVRKDDSTIVDSRLQAAKSLLDIGPARFTTTFTLEEESEEREEWEGEREEPVQDEPLMKTPDMAAVFSCLLGWDPNAKQLLFGSKAMEAFFQGLSEKQRSDITDYIEAAYARGEVRAHLFTPKKS
jgi:hypothetical protein